MNRLTNDYGIELSKDNIEEQIKKHGEAHPKYLRYLKLAEYENAGLEPEEIKDLIKAYNRDSTKCAQYEQLEEQGRLIKLPCVENDTVYAIDAKGNIHECKVYNITTNVYANESKGTPYWVGFEIKSHLFGKTVFLTQEEAEKALEGMNDNKRDT